MKTNPPLLKTFVPLFAVFIGQACAAINISSPATPDAFGSATAPANTDWSTVSVGTATDTTITTAAAFDAKIIAAAAIANITTALGTSPTLPPSTNAIARLNTGGAFLQTRPTGVDYTLLAAHLTNASGGPLNAIHLQANYSKATDTATETIKGLRAFYSTTGAAGSWIAIPEFSVDPGAAAVYTAPVPVSATINLAVPLAANAPFYVLWADQNSSGTDASYHIDDFAASPGAVTPVISAAAATNIVRHENGPGPADDTVTFDTTVSQSAAGASWTASGATPASGTYGALVTMTIPAPLPASPATVTFTDISTPATTNLSVAIPPRYVIGQTNFGTAQDIYTPVATPPSASWTNDPVLRTLAMTTGTGTDQVVTSETIDLTSVGAVAFTANFRAHETSVGSNFEVGDKFKAELIYTIAGSPVTVNLIDPWDLGDGAASTGDNGPKDGYLNGFTGVADTAAGVTAIQNYDTNMLRDEFNQEGKTADLQLDFTFPLSAVIPANADNVVLKIYGRGISGSEFFDVSDVLFAPSVEPSLTATAGAPIWNNHNTVNPADDDFTVPVTISASNLGTSTGWHENDLNTPVHSGLYSAPNPVTFGPYPGQTTVTGVILEDNLNTTVKAGPLTFTGPVSSIAATPAAAITRVPNGSGLADDTVTFTTTVTGTNAGIGWTATVPAPYTITSTAGAYGAVTFTIHSPGATAGPVAVTLTDTSYTAVSTNLSVTLPLPDRYDIGQKDLGAGLVTLESALNPPAEWVNDPVTRELSMTSSPATAKVVESETIDLSTVGSVVVSAKLVPSETSAGSNFETTDKFKIELVYTEGATTITKNLITEHDALLPANQHWDVGNGASALTVATLGANGAPDGWINGYNGAAGTNAGPSGTVYAAALDDYNDNRGRDEFNRLGEAGIIELNHPEVATNAGGAFSMDFTYTIPASADTAKLVITGVGAGGTEKLLVKDILFALAPAGPVDTDGDGMTDDYEIANGLNPTSAGDKLTDLDGDGQSNYAEFLAGTKANDSADTLKVLDIVPTGTPSLYNVSVSTVVGKKYQLQESTDLGQTDAWANLGSPVTATATTSTFPVNITGLGVRHFVRAEVVP